MDVETEAFLAHHGVLGMHWGKGKARFEAGGSNRKERNKAETAYKIQKSGGSKLKAEAKVAGKAVAVHVLLGASAVAIGKLSHNPSVGRGASKAAHILSAANGISATADIVRIARG